jgi:hypothetical protein
MPKKSRPTFQKRQKEQARQHKQQAKAARRLQAKQLRATAASAREAVIMDTANGPGKPPDIPALDAEASTAEVPRPRPSSRDTDV